MRVRLTDKPFACSISVRRMLGDLGLVEVTGPGEVQTVKAGVEVDLPEVDANRMIRSGEATLVVEKADKKVAEVVKKAKAEVTKADKYADIKKQLAEDLPPKKKVKKNDDDDKSYLE